MVAAVNY